MLEISCRILSSIFQRHLYVTEYEKKTDNFKYLKELCRTFLRKTILKNRNYSGIRKMATREQEHKSASSQELLGSTLCLFTVFKIWQMNT